MWQHFCLYINRIAYLYFTECSWYSYKKIILLWLSSLHIWLVGWFMLQEINGMNYWHEYFIFLLLHIVVYLWFYNMPLLATLFIYNFYIFDTHNSLNYKLQVNAQGCPQCLNIYLVCTYMITCCIGYTGRKLSKT